MSAASQEVRIQDHPALEDLSHTELLWRSVEAQCPTATPFVRWPWVNAWLRVYGEPLAPRLICGYRDEHPIGIALVGGRHILRHRAFPVHQLCLNTAGEAPRNPEGVVCVEFNHLLAPQTERADFAQALLRHLGQGQDWDEVLLAGFAPDEIQVLPAGWSLREEYRRPCHAMDLQELRRQGITPEDALSANTRQQIRRSLRLFGGREQVRLEEAGTVAQAHELLAELVALHQGAWQARGQDGVFADPRLLHFLGKLIDAGHPGGVQVLRLRDGAGRTLGISYNLRDPSAVYYYQSGFVQPQDPKEKPGLCLHLLAMERALAAGHERYEFMASDARYKQSLSNSRRDLLWGVIARPRVHLWLERAAVRLVHGARTLRARSSLGETERKLR